MMARQPNARRRAGYMVAYGGAMRCQRPKAIDPKNCRIKECWRRSGFSSRRLKTDIHLSNFLNISIVDSNNNNDSLLSNKNSKRYRKQQQRKKF